MPHPVHFTLLSGIVRTVEGLEHSRTLRRVLWEGIVGTYL